MRYRLAGLAFLLLMLPAVADEPKPLRVLFIGNSYTYVNELPAMVAELAKAGGQPKFEYETECPGGCTFEKHWKDEKAAKRIAEGKWDWVVLQEQSTRPFANKALMFEYAGKLDGEIKKAKAKTLLYQTWARADAPDKQEALSNAYLELGKELKADMVPAGDAWAAALKDDPTRKLHGEDKSHPAKAGTYLAACVFYAKLYGKSPVGLPGKPGDLSDAEAGKLQAIAWKTLEASKPKK